MHVINVASSDISAAYMPKESHLEDGKYNAKCRDTTRELSLQRH